MKINNRNFAETLEEQAQILGVELPRGQSKEKIEANKKDRETLLKILDKTMRFYHKNLLNNDKALSYLEKRGIGEVAISKFFLGLSPNSNNDLKNHLKPDFSLEQMLKAGVLYERNGEYFDRFRNRLMIPILDASSTCIAFGGRALLDGQNPKYINSPDSSVYNKSSVLFGMNYAKEAIREEDAVIIMEGYFDVISAHINGVKNAVASCGTALTPQHIKLISRYTPSRKIYLAFDSDAAGQKATQSGAEVIKNIFENLGNVKQYDSSFSDAGESVCEIRVVSQIGGKDPDEYIQEFGADEYKKQVQKAPLLLDYQLEKVFNSLPKNPTAQEKSNIAQEAVKILKEINNPIILAEYAKNTAFRLNIEESVLKTQIKFVQRNIVTNSQVIKIKPERLKRGLAEQFSRMENNLVKLAFVTNTPEKKVYFKQSIQGYKLTDERVLRVLDEIDKLLFEVNNVDELAKKILLVFYNDIETQKYITDQLYLSDEFEDLGYENYTQAIDEIFERLKKLQERRVKEEIREKYRSNDNDGTTEETELKISKEIFEKFGKQQHI